MIQWRMVIVLVLLATAVTILTGNRFSRPENLTNVARQISSEAIIAFGMTLVIITGGIDLSVGSLVALTGVVSGLVMSSLTSWGAFPCIATGMAAGMLLGAFFGSAAGGIITRFAIPPFIVTLAGMLIARGLAFIACDGQPVYQLPAALRTLGRGFVFPDLLGRSLPIPVAIMLVLFVLFHFILSRTVFGRSVVAVGSNEEAARLAGIPVRRTKLFVYVLTGGLCGIVGMLQNARLMSADPKTGETWELNVIAAVVVGGTSLFGGRGSIPGTLIGALIIGILVNSLNLMQVTHFWQEVVIGSVILLAALLDAGISRLGGKFAV